MRDAVGSHGVLKEGKAMKEGNHDGRTIGIDVVSKRFGNRRRAGVSAAMTTCEG
jgi:hypothetical protein